MGLGDCGHVNGNDFSMLDCSQGFSVGTRSDKNDCCFPVIDQERKLLTGIEGTIYLLDHAKILSTVCLESANREAYIKKFANIERKINLGRSDLLKKFDDIINCNFNTSIGIDGLFDKETGSLKIPMYEWELIADDNPLKILWSSTKNKSLMYALRDNDSYLLRGSTTYYHFISKRNNRLDETTGKYYDITTSDHVLQWYDNYCNFFKSSIEAIDKVRNLKTIYNKKMILGILDNIRNYLLVSMNYYIKITSDDQILLLNLESLNSDSPLYCLYSLLITVSHLMKEICLNINYEISKEQLNKILHNVVEIIQRDISEFYSSDYKENYSKDFRAYREIDNFFHNYINTELSMEKITLNDEDMAVCGLCYGGLELPIMFKVLHPNIKNIWILQFNNNATGYSKKQSSELRFFDIKSAGGMKILGIDCTKKMILTDDNLLTGKTVQLALNIMCDLIIDVDKISIVRYTSINRIDQMFLPNHGAINYNQFFNFIVGLTFPSPYSWRDPMSDDKYEDSLGIFDLNRKKIVECLIKNYDYGKTSEVAKYVLKVKK